MLSIIKKRVVPAILCAVFLSVQLIGLAPCTANMGTAANQKGQPEKQQVSPNPSVYPGFYQKGGATSDSSKLMTAASTQLFAEKESVAPKDKIPAAGKIEKVVVIPVQFSDVKFDSVHSEAYFGNIMTQLKDYYEKNSGYIPGSKGMTIDYTIASPVTSTKTMAYYGADSNGLGSDDANTEIYELARETVRLSDTGVDFSSFDMDKDGTVDHLFIIHAGDGQEDSDSADDIWSSSWEIKGGEKADNVVAESFTCVPATGTLGVFAHEFGHDIGLPDLYDPDDYLNGYTLGVGAWDVMGYGSWNSLPGEKSGTCPANLSAWSKAYLGWSTVTDITSDGTYTLANTSINNSAYRFSTNGNEYYLTEYRRKNGYDAALPGEGLLIWHIDKQWLDTEITVGSETGSALDLNKVNSYKERLGVELEQADGNRDLYCAKNFGDAYDPFSSKGASSNFMAVPYKMNYSNINKDQYMYIEVRNVNTTGNTATADYYVQQKVPAAAPSLLSPSNNSLVSLQPVFSWTPSVLAAGYQLQIAENSDFSVGLKEISLDGGSSALLYCGGYYKYILPSGTGLSGGKTYYCRIGAVNGLGTVWSQAKTIKTKVTATTPENVPGNVSNITAAASGSGIILSWSSVPNSTGYYVLADGVETTGSAITEMTFNDLLPNTRHEYQIRAVNESDTSDWSQSIITYTSGSPGISGVSGNITERSESGAAIVITIENGEFLADGIYNRATVSLDSGKLPKGVKEGTVTRLDPTHVQITLEGNSTESYSSDLSVPLNISKEIVTTARYSDLSSNILFKALPKPATPSGVTFSFDGANALKLMGTNSLMEFSLDSGSAYIAITTTDQALTVGESTQINENKDIRIRYKAADPLPASSALVIDILPGPAAPNVTANDSANLINGITGSMEFSTDQLSWIRYNNNLPNLSGVNTIYVRTAATGVTMHSRAATLIFTPTAAGNSGSTGDTGTTGSIGNSGGSIIVPPAAAPAPAVVAVPAATPAAPAAATSSAVTLPAFGEKELGSQIDSAGTTVTAKLTSTTAQAILLDGSTFCKISEKGKSLTVDTPKVDISLPAGAMSTSLLKAAGSDAKLKLGVEPVAPGDVLRKLKDASQDDGKGLFSISGCIFEFSLQIVSPNKTQVITNFSAPITVTISLKDTNLGSADPDKLGVYYYNETTGSWEYMGGVYNAAAHSITFTTTHFSLYSVMKNDITFDDIKTHWAKADIEKLAAKYITTGVGNGKFNPEGTVTRAEFISWLVRALQLDKASSQGGAMKSSQKAMPFRDVAKGKWYTAEISLAYQYGIAGEGASFRPDARITREEMASMISAALKYVGKGSKLTESQIDAQLKAFRDSEKIQAGIRSAVAEAVKQGILTGRPGKLFAPGANATRAEGMVMIRRMLAAVK